MTYAQLLLTICLLVLPIRAESHKIHVFAWVSGETVTVESGFSGNKPLLHGKVTVKEKSSGLVLLQGNGDNKGIFTFTIPPEAKARKADLLIVVSGSEGHQSEWLIPASEYLSEGLSQNTDINANISNEELETLIRKIIEQELAPIKRRLAQERQNTPEARDIIAGVTFLLGLGGIISWFRYRKQRGAEADD